MTRFTAARGLAAFTLLVAMLSSLPAGADEIDDILGGFDDDEAPAMPEALPEPDSGRDPAPWELAFWDLTGSVSLGSSINYRDHESGDGTEYGGLSRLRTRLNLQLDADLPYDWKFRLSGFGFYDWAYRINGRDRYNRDVLDSYEWDAEFQEVWIQGSPFESLDLKIGRQVVNWGRSDTLRVLDVLNPLDNREPGLVDIEDLRRPVAMARMDFYLGDWSLTGIAIPEIRFDENPPFGSDFAPDISPSGTPAGFQVSLDTISERMPDDFHGNTEWAAALMGVFEGWDVSFHLARIWQDVAHLAWDLSAVAPLLPLLPTLPPGPLPPGLVIPTPRLEHSRVTMAGAGANYTFGSWLLKAEVAYLNGVDYPVSRVVPVAFIDTQTGLPVPSPGSGNPFIVPILAAVPVGTLEKSRIDAMGGVEYYGFTDITVALEVVNRHIHRFDPSLRAFHAQRNALETALRITGNFLNDRLETTALGVAFGSHGQEGSIVRLSVAYDLRDALVLTGGVVLYQDGDSPFFRSIDANDRLFFEIKYSF